MWTGNVKSVAFWIGEWPVQWYGIIITSAMLVGLLVGTMRLKRVNITSDDTLSLFLWAIPIAVIMARLGYVVSRYEWYFTSPYDWNAFIDTIAIWDGGLTIMWGVPGGVLGALIWSKIHKKSLIQIADIVLPVVLLSQALGRWGNFCNQELYGQMITNPSAQWFPLAVYIAEEQAFFQATFFYEFVLNIIGFLVLSYFVKRFDVKGFGTLLYVVWYCLVRGSLEFIRDDGNSSFDGAVNLNIVLCYVIAAFAAIVIVLLFIRKKKSGGQIYFKKGIPPLSVPEKPESKNA